ncbi:uncharacterized protein K452DRAFT_275344 [Aplosporella prunicola CBS 121167]|uniref:Hemerythrin-like domain-containing protein n=1 Tax=Aplosporella prunicola CBS 121167 TaxID=1176127 RepID=A0A6A6B8J5_9PEZI|nr:uncharacterized protein K452DRAFT_275344 [Aplosporella prunicola CBS 121167]KAF2139227.1 hypothetical protein K452DRAFT_275344 [Aplosporella prunicola CBS 121167]
MTRISESIKQDHRELENAYNKIKSATTADEKTRWQNQFTWELARHSIGEELVVYPAMEKYLTEGKTMAEKDRGQHQTVKEQLYKFQGLKADDKEFMPTLQSLWTELSEHIKDEENHDLPALEKKLQEIDSEDLTTSFERTKMFTPTRSHPSAPDKPPYETVVGLMSAPIDRLADLFRKFPKDSSPASGGMT